MDVFETSCRTPVVSILFSRPSFFRDCFTAGVSYGKGMGSEFSTLSSKDMPSDARQEKFAKNAE